MKIGGDPASFSDARSPPNQVRTLSGLMSFDRAAVSVTHRSSAALPRYRALGSRPLFTPGSPLGSLSEASPSKLRDLRRARNCSGGLRSPEPSLHDPGMLKLSTCCFLLRLSASVPNSFCSELLRSQLPFFGGERCCLRVAFDLAISNSNPGEQADGASIRLIPTPTVCRMCNVSQLTSV